MKEKTKWKRNCPECRVDILYSYKCSYVRGMKKNNVCRSCSQTGKKQSIDTIEKRASKLRGRKRPEHSKLMMGCGNPMYGKAGSWSGKKNLLQSIRMSGDNNPSKRQDVRDKISDFHKGKPKSKSHKQNISENHADFIGENHPKIKKIMNDEGISYIEYRDRKTDMEKYKQEVMYITEKQPLHLLENYNKRGHFSYHLDHIYPISKGFENNILPEVIGDISNLQMLWWKDNLKKSNKVING